MSYKIKRCKICNKEIHIHKKQRPSGYRKSVLKNKCEHIQKLKDLNNQKNLRRV